jgi:hypothetical protein
LLRRRLRLIRLGRLRGLRIRRLLLRLLGGLRRLLCRGRVALLRAQLGGNQQRAQDAHDSVLHCHKTLGEFLILAIKPCDLWSWK